MLGDLSKKYESSGDCGTISSGYGDAGGKSYGMYQFASNMGVADKYVKWLQDNGYWFGDELAKYTVGSSYFDEAIIEGTLKKANTISLKLCTMIRLVMPCIIVDILLADIARP